MSREHYKLFSPAAIGPLTVPNRLVRSATWDPAFLFQRKMIPPILEVYRRLAAGGTGLIITGDLSIVPDRAHSKGHLLPGEYGYDDVRVEGHGRIVDVIRDIAPDVKVVSQIGVHLPGAAPSEGVPSPFPGPLPRALSIDEIEILIGCLVSAIEGMAEDGFDGVQFHACHGGLLGCFLSPYFNRRTDRYGGSATNRARLIAEVIALARERVGEFPILIKMNVDDFLPGGIDRGNLPDLARAVAKAGVDAIEFSGGTWESLSHPQEELGFPPVPLAESRTRLARLAAQSYFKSYIEKLDLPVPKILVGGNRNVEYLEDIVQQGAAEFISLCRPLIREPDLPQRWREGRGKDESLCSACNSCVYDMFTHVDRGEVWVTRCLVEEDRSQVQAAQEWLLSWVEENICSG